MLHPPISFSRGNYAALADVVYLITFSGAYHTLDSSSERIKTFDPITLKMTQRMAMEGPLSVFKNEFAPVVFPKMYSDFKMLYKYRVDSTVREDGQPVTDLNLMNRGEITSVIVRENLPINVALYKNADALREALIRYIEDETGFAREQHFKTQTLNKTARIAASFQDLNPDVFGIVQKAQDAELQNKIVNQPGLYDVLATKNAVDAIAAQEGLIVSEVNTTGIPSNQIGLMAGGVVPTQQPRGYIENAALDQFPDGVPKQGGKPIKNPLGTQPQVKQQQQQQQFNF